MRVALVHYWLLNWRGGEKVLKAIRDIYPQADIFTHVFDPEMVARELPGQKVSTTFIARLPFARRWYQKYLPLMPLALEQLDLRGYDLVISTESGPAKGVIVGPQAQHLCYCLSPMRYLWDMYHDYRAGSGAVTRFAMSPLLHYVRMWDQLSAQRVDRFVSISRFVAARVAKYYSRSSTLVYPPVAVDDFTLSRADDGFYLSVGQLVRYKRADLLVEAFNRNGRRLVIIGEGELLEELRRIARPNVELLGWQPFKSIREHYERCRALVFPGVEDFGIVPVEAMACGKPVIAFGAGGALDTVEDGVSGLLFHRQDVDSLNDAIEKLERGDVVFDPAAVRRVALRFGPERFASEFSREVDLMLSAPAAGSASR